MLSHIKGQTDTCGEQQASVLGVVLVDPVHHETHQEKHPEIASAQFWDDGSSDAEPFVFVKSQGERGSKTSPCLKGTWDPWDPISAFSITELLLNAGWVIYPLCCFPQFHRMEMIIFDQRGGGWKDPLHFLKCSKIHKWRVQYGPWKYHLHLARPPLGLLFANNRRRPKSS